MKVFVEDMSLGLTPNGEGVVTMYGLDLWLTLVIPGHVTVRIAETRDHSLRVDPRKSIIDLLEDDIKRLEVEELVIDRMNEQGVYTASLKIQDHVYDVVPSEGLLLCSLVGAPIYFESSVKGVKRQQPDQRTNE